MSKPFYSIISNTVEQVAEILIYGLIGQDLSGEGNAAKSFLKDFQELERTAKRIHIRINSPGGSVWEGLPIFNAIRASKAEVHTYVDGIAYSMAAMITLAGHQIHMAKGSLLMLHNVSTGEYGNAEKMRKAADQMDKYDAILAELIAERSGKSADFVRANWMNYCDNYFTPEEAKAAGLIDFIESYAVENIPPNIHDLNLFQVAAFYQKQSEKIPTLLQQLMNGLRTTFINDKMDMTKNEKQTIYNESEESEETISKSEVMPVEELNQLVDRLETAVEKLDQLVARLETTTSDQATSADTSAEIEALRARLNAVATRPSTPYAQTDRVTISSKEDFETSYDRDIKAFFKEF